MPTEFWIDAVRFCVTGWEQPSALPDLVAIGLQRTGQGCKSGPDSVTFSVANRGEGGASNFYVRIATQNTFDEWRVANLPAGKSLQFAWDGIPGNVNYTGAVDPAGLVVEANETNNHVSQELWIKGRCTFLPIFWLIGPD